MGAQAGKDLLLKVDSTGSGPFTTVAGLRARRLAFDAATVDATDADSSGRWRELLAGAGVKRASIAGSGLFKDADSDALVRSLFFSGTIRDWRVVVPDFGAVEGPFLITGLSYGGDHDGEVNFELSLESAGALSFSAD